MRIDAMTATFGKLEHEKLTFKPGLNVIQAPNEWGKSTWCAFLVSMFYGVDTRAKTTKTALADKEKYLPWSGSPMSGRMELNWRGKNITIERRTKGRTPMGEFRAYETESGLSVPELTASNCGTVLLGVEKSVFLRAGFLKMTDLPVTQDDALQQRLNALVTTGDESGNGEQLAQKLKDLKNRCRHNRTGLLPQAEMEKEQLSAQYQELQMLQEQQTMLQQRQNEAKQLLDRLKNHKTALEYKEAEENNRRIREAEAARDEAACRAAAAEENCRGLLSRREAEQDLIVLEKLQNRWMSMQTEEQNLPQHPQMPQPPRGVRACTPEEAVQQAKRDAAIYQKLQEKRLTKSIGFWLLGAALLLSGTVVLWTQPVMGVIFLAIGAGSLTGGMIHRSREKQKRTADDQKRQELEIQYGSKAPDDWIRSAETFQEQQNSFRKEALAFQKQRMDLDCRIRELQQQIRSACAGTTAENRKSILTQTIQKWEQLERLQAEFGQAERHFQSMQAMGKPMQPPSQPDERTDSLEETQQRLLETEAQLRRIQVAFGQCQGKMEVLGDEKELRRSLTQAEMRIHRLENTYAALELAQNTLAEAAADLRRRYAPKISARARSLFERLTDRRYNRLSLGEDLSVYAGTQQEDTLRSSLWHSDGTVDQLYLSLRLAVAEELTPDAPLILDDALVRFDDQRLKRALDILKEESAEKQILLFTCQSREKNLM